MHAHRSFERSRALPRLAAAGVLALAAAAAQAQSAEIPPDAAAPEVQDLISRSFGLSGEAGRLIGSGRDYSARFEPGRFTYTPALGRTAPATMPVAFTLEEVRLGETVLLDVDAPVAPVRQGNVVVYPHPGGIDERYEVRADGVHQTFLFDELPEGSGDLVVRGHLDTELMRCSEGMGARFELPGFGGVSWGGVTGVDAGGATAMGDVRLDGTSLELVLPAAFVSRASLPLVLDPLVGTVLDGATGVNDDFDPDVAFDTTENAYLIVWERWYASDNTAIRGQRFTSGGSPEGSLIEIVTNPMLSESFIASRPSVASVNTTDRFLVVWQESAAGAFSTIRCAAIDADDGEVSAKVTCEPIFGTQLTPVVGGERALVDDDAVVVWRQVGLGLRMRQMTVPAAGAPFGVSSASTLMADGGGFEHVLPAISRTSGEDGRFLVAWQRNDVTGFGKIAAQVVSRHGAKFGSDMLISGTDGGLTNTNPAVDGDGEQWVVAWQREEPSQPKLTDILCRAMSWNGAALEIASDVESLENDANDHEHAVSVAWTGASALIAYSDQSGAGDEIFAKAVDPFTCADCEDEMVVFGASGNTYHTAVVSEWSGGADLGALDNAWILFDTTPIASTDEDVLFFRYDAPDQPTDLGGGCAGGGLNVNPCAFESNPQFQLQLVGAAPNAPTFCVLSALTEPFPSGACIWTPKFLPGMVILPRMTDGDGNAFANAPIPGNTAGITIYTQWATLHAGGMSPLLGGVSFSNALEVPINP